jgi:hypothetical protein
LAFGNEPIRPFIIAQKKDYPKVAKINGKHTFTGMPAARIITPAFYEVVGVVLLLL